MGQSGAPSSRTKKTRGDRKVLNWRLKEVEDESVVHSAQLNRIEMEQSAADD